MKFRQCVPNALCELPPLAKNDTTVPQDLSGAMSGQLDQESLRVRDRLAAHDERAILRERMDVVAEPDARDHAAPCLRCASAHARSSAVVILRLFDDAGTT